jgi:hypothetical protein
MSFRIEHRIGVAAPASVIWEVLSDFSRWGDWNPIYPVIDARLSIGAPLAFELHLPNRPVRQLQGAIVEWVPETQLIWSLKLFSGLVRTTRYFEIETLADGACILCNGEIFDGLGAGLVPKPERAVLKRAFELVNEAAKARAEDLHRGLG